MEPNEARDKILKLLKNEYASIQVRRVQFSLRSFARKLGLPSPVLIQVMNGKRPITRNIAQQLLSRLEMPASEALDLVRALPQRRSSADVLKDTQIELPEQTFEVVSDWWYFAVLSLAELENFKLTASSAARRLNITLTQARKAVSVLKNLGYLSRTGASFRASGQQFTTTGDIPSFFILKNHAQGLELASRSLHAVPVEKRDFSSLTLAMAESSIPQLKNLIAKFRQDLRAKIETEKNKDAVYRIQIQLFPLSKKI